jgi:hypothetical protein
MKEIFLKPIYDHDKYHEHVLRALEFELYYLIFQPLFDILEYQMGAGPKAPPEVEIREGHTPTLEKMLVDLFVIKDKYSTMTDSDYWELWRSMDGLFRINVSALIAYAKNRRYFRGIISQLVDNIGLNNVTFGAYIKYAAKVISKKDIHGKTNS